MPQRPKMNKRRKRLTKSELTAKQKKEAKEVERMAQASTNIPTIIGWFFGV